MLPPSFLGPDIGVPGAGLLMQPLHLLEGDELVEAGVNRLVGGGQVIEELGLFIVVQVVLTNVLILCVGVCHVGTGWLRDVLLLHEVDHQNATSIRCAADEVTLGNFGKFLPSVGGKLNCYD